ncbi:MAG: hypothetical protein MZW92_16400 [Comamonadaceae bacterium]|nr:hypothetical protein [Comamonadaceae bacterium]
MMSAAAWWLFAPYFAGAWINSRLWTRRDMPFNTAYPGVLLGRIPTDHDLTREGIRAVVDLMAELPLRGRDRVYRNVPVLDLTLPSEAQLTAAVRAIESACRAGPTLVCCALGYSRSALACGAWLLLTGRAPSVEDALGEAAARTPSVVLDERHAGLLRRLADSRDE